MQIFYLDKSWGCGIFYYKFSLHELKSLGFGAFYYKFSLLALCQRWVSSAIYFIIVICQILWDGTIAKRDQDCVATHNFLGPVNTNATFTIRNVSCHRSFSGFAHMLAWIYGCGCINWFSMGLIRLVIRYSRHELITLKKVCWPVFVEVRYSFIFHLKTQFRSHLLVLWNDESAPRYVLKSHIYPHQEPSRSCAFKRVNRK